MRLWHEKLSHSSEIENPYSDSSDQADPLSITGLETFSLCYKVCCVLVVLLLRVFFPFFIKEYYMILLCSKGIACCST